MLAGLGFSPFHAAAICLLANTAPVAFGSIAIPIVTLAGITGLPLHALERGCRTHLRSGLADRSGLPGSGDGRLGRAGARVSRGAAVRRHLRGLAVHHLQLRRAAAYRPDRIALPRSACWWCCSCFGSRRTADKYELSAAAKAAETSEHSIGQVFLAWSPYLLLVICVLLWGWPPMMKPLNSVSIPIHWPGLHNLIARIPPVTAKVSPYASDFQPELAVGLGNVLHDRLHPVVLRAARAAASGAEDLLRAPCGSSPSR